MRKYKDNIFAKVFKPNSTLSLKQIIEKRKYRRHELNILTDGDTDPSWICRVLDAGLPVHELYRLVPNGSNIEPILMWSEYSHMLVLNMAARRSKPEAILDLCAYGLGTIVYDGCRIEEKLAFTCTGLLPEALKGASLMRLAVESGKPTRVHDLILAGADPRHLRSGEFETHCLLEAACAKWSPGRHAYVFSADFDRMVRSLCAVVCVRPGIFPLEILFHIISLMPRYKTVEGRGRVIKRFAYMERLSRWRYMLSPQTIYRY